MYRVKWLDEWGNLHIEVMAESTLLLGLGNQACLTIESWERIEEE